MRKRDENGGITLIVLVITIVIMLILVGVTVNMAIDGNLFKKAGEAVDKTNAKVGKLQQDVDYYTNKLNEVSDKESDSSNDFIDDWNKNDFEYSDDGIGLVMGYYIEEGKYFKRSRYPLTLLGLELKTESSLVSVNEEKIQTVEITKCANSTEKLSSGYKVNRAADDAAGLGISEKMYTKINSLIGIATRLDYARQCVEYAQYATGKILKDEMIMREYYEISETLQKSIKLGSNTMVTTSESGIFELARKDALKMAEEQAIFKEGSTKSYILRDGVDSGAQLTYTKKDGTQKSINILKIPAIVENGLKTVTKENYYGETAFLVENTKSEMDGLSDRLIILGEYTIRMLNNTMIAYSNIRDTDMADEMIQYSNNNILQQAGQRTLAQYDQSSQETSAENENTSSESRAADDAAELSISEKMRTQISGLTQAQANAEDAILLVDTTEDAMAVIIIAINKEQEYYNEAIALYDRPNTLERENRLRSIEKNMKELIDVIDYMANSTEFNGIRLVDGTFINKNIQIGSEVGQTITISIGDVTADGLGLSNINYSTKEGLEEFRIKLNSAKQKLNEERAKCNAIKNRLEHTANNLENIIENTQSAESQIRDTDMAD
jgi:flagellin